MKERRRGWQEGGKNLSESSKIKEGKEGKNGSEPAKGIEKCGAEETGPEQNKKGAEQPNLGPIRVISTEEKGETLKKGEKRHNHGTGIKEVAEQFTVHTTEQKVTRFNRTGGGLVLPTFIQKRQHHQNPANPPQPPHPANSHSAKCL